MVRLSSQQWKSGIAAWLGWTFDGLDMHLYTLVYVPFVAQTISGASFPLRGWSSSGYFSSWGTIG